MSSARCDRSMSAVETTRKTFISTVVVRFRLRTFSIKDSQQLNGTVATVAGKGAIASSRKEQVTVSHGGVPRIGMSTCCRVTHVTKGIGGAEQIAITTFRTFFGPSRPRVG